MLVAFAVALDRFGEPLPRLLRIAAHELRDPGSGRGVAHPRQLALASVVILHTRQSILAVAVPFLFAPCVLRPIRHGRSL